MVKEIIDIDVPKVRDLCKRIIGKDFKDISRMGGLTNHTYHVVMDDACEFVVRIPGEGTEDLIVRDDERKSTELACNLDIDAELLYFGNDGSKVTRYIKDAITMNRESMKKKENLSKAAEIFRKLHSCGIDTGVKFEVFNMAKTYENVIKSNSVSMFDDYETIKKDVMSIKNVIDNTFDIIKVPCHNDALCENWVIDDQNRMYLIDWEYAGMNDGLWDLADVSIEAELPESLELFFLTAYLQKNPSVDEMKHYIANKIYVDFLWTLWAKTRVPFDGQPMEDWAKMRYERLKKTINVYNSLK